MSGAAAAAIANAVKASGAIVRVERQGFQSLLARAEGCVLVYAEGGFLSKKHHYLLSYKGLAFHMKSDQAVPLPGDIEVIKAKKIWIPG